jgi:hypothetical protein
MAERLFGTPYNNPTGGVYGRTGKSYTRKVELSAAADTSDWIVISGPCNILIDGGSAFTLDVERATETDKSDNVVVGSHTESDRSARYDFVGEGYTRLVLNTLTAGPVTARIVGA